VVKQSVEQHCVRKTPNIDALAGLFPRSLQEVQQNNSKLAARALI
jgi:hypothetical protein